MSLLSKIYFRISWLSIDVVLGAIAGAIFFSKLLRVELEWEVYLLLGMAVWSIYTGDHLLDSRRKMESNLSPRHQFHLRHKIALSLILGLVLVGGVSFAYLIFGTSKELIWSLILGVLILSSMILIRKAGKSMVWSKEISIAIFYVLGIAWIPLLRVDAIDLNWDTWIVIACYILLAFMNLLILSQLDRKQDEQSGFHSSAQLFSSIQFIHLIRKLSFILLILELATFILFPSFFRPFSSLLMVMTLVHYLAFFNPKLSPEQVRVRTEAAFMLPFLLFFL
jgi:hypothetical protein